MSRSSAPLQYQTRDQIAQEATAHGWGRVSCDRVDMFYHLALEDPIVLQWNPAHDGAITIDRVWLDGLAQDGSLVDDFPNSVAAMFGEMFSARLAFDDFAVGGFLA